MGCESFDNDHGLSKRYVFLARKMGVRHRVRLSSHLKQGVQRMRHLSCPRYKLQGQNKGHTSDYYMFGMLYKFTKTDRTHSNFNLFT